jgi:hypothetical protein
MNFRQNGTIYFELKIVPDRNTNSVFCHEKITGITKIIVLVSNRCPMNENT